MNEQPLNLLLVGEWLIAVGILAVAAAALWSLRQTRRAMQADATPNVMLDGVAVELDDNGAQRSVMRATAVNLGRHPVYLLAVEIDTDALNHPARVTLRRLIPASEVIDLEVALPRLTAIEGGDLRMEFYYGSTGARLHRQSEPLIMVEGTLRDEPTGRGTDLDAMMATPDPATGAGSGRRPPG